MKKIFLLSLLSVFFLSAFSQIVSGDAEIISKINIIRSSDGSEITSELGNQSHELGFWIFFWNSVTTIYSDDGSVTVLCSGWGMRICAPRLKGHSSSSRGISSEAMEQTCEDIVADSDARASQGEYKGSLTRKTAFNDPLANGRIAYLIYQMNWDYDPRNPRNGKAEIIISKTYNLGIK